MKEIELEGETVHLFAESGNVRVLTKKENVVLANQSVDKVSELIGHNFNIVSNHYKLMLSEAKNTIDLEDISLVSTSIVLHYLYMYNSWRNIYEKQENRDLRFSDKDFGHPSTHDLIFDYFKKKYLNDWEEKCAVLLGKELTEVRAYYKTRESYYNK